MSREVLGEKLDKLVKLAGHQAAIHPEKSGGTYAEWMSVLFAVKNELGARSAARTCAGKFTRSSTTFKSDGRHGLDASRL